MYQMFPFLAAAYGTVSDIEIAWVIIALVGLVYSLLNIKSAKNDVNWVNSQNISNGRKFLARFSYYSEIIRAVIQFIFVTIGFMAMFLPEVPDSVKLPTAQLILRVFVTWGLMISSVLLTIKSYLGKKARDIIS